MLYFDNKTSFFLLSPVRAQYFSFYNMLRQSVWQVFENLQYNGYGGASRKRYQIDWMILKR